MTAGRRPVRYARSGAIPALVTIAVVAATLAVVGMSPTLNPLDVLAGRGVLVDVPTVVGETQTRALVELSNRRLAGDVSFAYSHQVQRGHVVAQSPVPGEQAPRNSKVDIVISRGAGAVEVPDVELQPEADAVALLGAVELEPLTTRLNDEDVPAGVVISQSPSPGAAALTGDPVWIVVSDGPVIREVPPLFGLPLYGAAFNLGRTGLAVGEVVYEAHVDVPLGGLIRTEPAEGEKLPRDSEVTLVMSEGPPAATVPDVVGLSRSEASTVLTEAGYVVAFIVRSGGDGNPNTGAVIQQDPRAGAPARADKVVTIVELR